MKTYTAMEYLEIDVANFAVDGLDRKQFEDRLDWTQKNMSILEAHTPNADNPYRYKSAVMALRDAQAGKPIGHLVGLDVCSSGKVCAP